MIIVDTGFWLALIDEGDPYHQKAVMALEKYNNEPLITTWCVITETTYLLLSRLGTQAAINFIESLHQGFFTIFPLENTHTSRIIELMKKYADLPMDLNLELGLLTDQAKLAKQIHRTFDVLIRDRVLIPFR